MDHEKLVQVWYKMQAKKKALEKAHKAAISEINEQEAILLGALHKSLLDNKVKSMATNAGTFFFRKVVKASCTDWDLYRKWMVENDALDGVEKRVGQGFVASYLEDNNDEPPPGIAVFTEQVVSIRAPTK